jgi:hypothetical protein
VPAGTTEPRPAQLAELPAVAAIVVTHLVALEAPALPRGDSPNVQSDTSQVGLASSAGCATSTHCLPFSPPDYRPM